MFIPSWEKRFTMNARNEANAHRPPGTERRLERILSICKSRKIASDYTVSLNGQTCAIAKSDICAGQRRAQIKMERCLDNSIWGRFRNADLTLRLSAKATGLGRSSSGFRSSEDVPKPKPKPKKIYIPHPDPPWGRIFLFCVNTTL